MTTSQRIFWKAPKPSEGASVIFVMLVQGTHSRLLSESNLCQLLEKWEIEEKRMIGSFLALHMHNATIRIESFERLLLRVEFLSSILN